MLPKFLLADNSLVNPETLYVVHNEEPKFIIEFNIESFNKNQIIHWLDKKPEDERIIKILLEKTEQYLDEELENEDYLHDEMLDEDEEDE